MITEDQREAVELLASPATHGGAAVERIDTHASIVFLAGSRALKLKRAVLYDYLDFSTADRRRLMCEAEVRVNRRSAPELYRGVLAITREPDGSLALGGKGTPIDWVVEMARFDQDFLLDRMAERAALPLETMRPLAAAVARLHAGAERTPHHGGRSGMAWVIDGNEAGFAEQGAGILDPDACRDLTRESRAALDRAGPLLDARRESGAVRRCHGDLHLRNIVMLNGVPTLFDGVEFNDEIACIDVLYDLAFLLMDLWRRHLPAHANRVWNGYLFETAEFDGLPLLPLFLSCRAAIRAKTTATSASMQEDPARRTPLEATAREYLALARALLAPPPPRIIAIGGFSGSGKSTLALGLAPLLGGVPGAVIVRSDELRKQLAGVHPLVRLDPSAYTPEFTRRVYDTLVQRAAQVVRGGCTAIVDAVFNRADHRTAIEQAAASAGVPFTGFWLQAPEPVLVARAAVRAADPSDADAGVIRRQLGEDPGPIRWHRLEAGGGREEVLAAALAMLGAGEIENGKR